MRNLGLGVAIGVALLTLVWLNFGRAPTGLDAGSGRPSDGPPPSPPAGPAETIRAGHRATGAVSATPTLGERPAPAPATVSARGPGTLPAASATLSPQQVVDIARRQPAAVRTSPTTVAQAGGQLSVAAVRAGIDAARPAVKRCYEEALSQKAGLAGKLMIKFVVAQEGGKGRIREADLDEEASDETMLNPFLGMCVLKAMGEIEYPAPEGEGEVVVRFPFQFDATPDTP